MTAVDAAAVVCRQNTRNTEYDGMRQRRATFAPRLPRQSRKTSSLEPPEGLHYANASRIANSRTAGCIVPHASAVQVLCSGAYPTPVASAALSGKRDACRERERERVVTTRINYDRPFGVCSPFYERGAPDSSTSLSTDLHRGTRELSPLPALFAISPLLDSIFRGYVLEKGRRTARVAIYVTRGRA